MRLAVPLLPGLWLGRLSWQHAGGGAAELPLLAGTLLAGGWCLWTGVRSLRGCPLQGGLKRNVSFGVSACLFFFFFGSWRSYQAWENLQVDWPDGKREYHVILSGTPQVSSRTVGAEAMLTDGRGSAARRGCKLWLAFARDPAADALRTGDELVFMGRVSKPGNRGNPEEFDYAGYLAVKGISGSAFVGKGRWMRLHGYGDASRHLPVWADLRVKALLLRDKMLDVYRCTGLRGEALNLFAALTLGDKSGLSGELKDVYAEVGVSHVLALSGMHLGFLVAMLDFLVLGRFRKRRLLVPGAALVIVTVWGYVFLAGLPPSLVRAALMYSLMLAGSLAGRSGFSVNSLAASAALMACFNPLWIHDVGFHLSFSAMAGILTVCPRIQVLPVMRWRHVRWIFQSLSVSFAAQLFTVPLVAYRFGTFSPYSAWATLVITPLTALLIYGMPLSLLSGITGVGTAVGSWWVERLATWQNECLRAIAEWPCAAVRTDWSLWFTAWCYTALCVCVMFPFRTRVRKVRFVFAAAILTLCAFAANRQACRVRPEIVFYDNPSCPSVHVIYSPGRSYLFPAQGDSVATRMSHIAETFWEKKLSAAPAIVVGDFRDSYVSLMHGLATGRGGVSFLMLTDDRWNGTRGTRRADIGYLHVCRGFRGSIRELSRLFNPRCVVLDASLRWSDRKRYVQECNALGWRFHDMNAEGALKVALN